MGGYNINIYNKIKLWNSENFKMLYNKKVIQGFLSTSCGAYAVCFSYYMCMGVSFEKYLNLFDDNLKNNDKFVTDFFKKISNGSVNIGK